VTFGVAIESGDFSKFIPFFVAQMLGAMLGALLVWLHFLPHWRETEDPGLKLACFSTMPAIPNFGANLLSEIIGTFVLLVGVAVIFSKKVAIGGPVAGLGPYLVGVLVWAIGLSLGGTTGYAINPARDLGPRIVHSLLPLGEKKSSGWRYAAVPVIGPLTGAGLAGLFVRLAHL
jgi:glycerol uptake facilitator protein